MYLPSSQLPHGARALVPLGVDAGTHIDPQRLDDRLVAFYGDGPDDVGLLVSTPGSAALRLLQYPPGGTMDEISVAVTQVAVASLRIAHGIEVGGHGDHVEVRFIGESVPAGWLASAVEMCLGSLAASIAAALVAEAKGRRVTIESESLEGSTRRVTLALLPE